MLDVSKRSSYSELAEVGQGQQWMERGRNPPFRSAFFLNRNTLSATYYFSEVSYKRRSCLSKGKVAVLYLQEHFQLAQLHLLCTVVITVRLMLLGWCVVLIYNETLLLLYQQCKISKIGGQLGFCHVDKSSWAIFFSFWSTYILSSGRNKTSRKRRSYWEDWTISADPALQAVVFGWEALSK